MGSHPSPPSGRPRCRAGGQHGRLAHRRRCPGTSSGSRSSARQRPRPRHNAPGFPRATTSTSSSPAGSRRSNGCCPVSLTSSSPLAPWRSPSPPRCCGSARPGGSTASGSPPDHLGDPPADRVVHSPARWRARSRTARRHGRRWAAPRVRRRPGVRRPAARPRRDAGATVALRADLVVDATGRRSRLPEWLNDSASIQRRRASTRRCRTRRASIGDRPGLATGRVPSSRPNRRRPGEWR